MAKLAHEDIAEVLSEIANETQKRVEIDPMNTGLAMLAIRLGSIITDFLDERPENLQRLYDEKLNFVSDE